MDKRKRLQTLVDDQTEGLVDLTREFRENRRSVGSYIDILENRFALKEPFIKSFITRSEECFMSIRRQARRLEEEYPESSSRPSLYGVPFGAKDIYRTRDFPTRAGTSLRPELFDGPEAEAVAKLKSAGALVLGKTVTTEFAYFAPAETRNPHNLDYTPGGSSSGSSAAVAAGLCPLALGSQTAGSVIRPASYCGVVGFKPSFGRMSFKGVIPLAPSLDHAGFFTKDVRGAAMAASILCEQWTTADSSRSPVLGIPEGPYLDRTTPAGLDHFRTTCHTLSEAGVEIIPIKMFPDFYEILNGINSLLAAEAAETHREWFRMYPDTYRKETAGLIRAGQKVDKETVDLLREGRERLRDEITAIMATHGITAFVTPAATGPAPKGLESTGDPVMNSVWTYAGLPSITLPSGMSDEGLPLGLQLIGLKMGDEALLNDAERIAELMT